MSKTYRIRLGVEQILLHGNLLKLPINLVQILPLEGMKDLLQNALENSGWIKEPKGWIKRMQGSVDILIPPEMDNILMEIAEREVLLKQSLSPEQLERVSKGEAIEASELGLESGLDEAQLLQSITQSRKVINTVLAQVYKEAVLQKAGELGTVESIVESEGPQGMRVRILVQG